MQIFPVVSILHFDHYWMEMNETSLVLLKIEMKVVGLHADCFSMMIVSIEQKSVMLVRFMDCDIHLRSHEFENV